VSIEINYNYVENVLFYLDSNLNPETLNIKKNQEKNSIFQDDEFKYYFKINNTELYDKVKEELEKAKEEFGVAKSKNNNISLDKIDIHAREDGFVNIRIYCSAKEKIDIDKFSFDSKYEQVCKILYKFLITNKQQYDDKEIRYLYHQHIVSDKLDTKEDINVKWSVYEHLKNIQKKYIELDTLLLEKSVMYYVFSQEYIKQLNPNEQKITLNNIRKLINTNRYLLASHTLNLQELKSEFFEEYFKLYPIHKIDKMEELYNRLESNIEHYSEQLEDERRHKESEIMQIIFLILTVIGIISVITGILALLPDATKVCDPNVTVDNVLTQIYSVSVEYPFLLILLVINVGGLAIYGLIKFIKDIMII